MSHGTYVPNYPNPTSEGEILTASGMLSFENVQIEEAVQRTVAENHIWLLARKVKWIGGDYVAGIDSPGGIDSRSQLEAMGFTILKEHDALFYEVEPPPGWNKSTEGCWTTIIDNAGKKRISQFFKGAWYDCRASLHFHR